MACGKRGAFAEGGLAWEGGVGTLWVPLCVIVDLTFGMERRDVCVSVGIVFESGSLRGGGRALHVEKGTNNLPRHPGSPLTQQHALFHHRSTSLRYARTSLSLSVAAVSPPAHLSSLISLHTFFAILYTPLSKAERLANELRRLRQSIHTTPHRRHNNRVRSRLVREATN